MTKDAPKTLLDEFEENARHIALCPACSQTPGLADNAINQMGPGPSNGYHKRGRWRGYPRSAMPVCRFCQGRGVVFLNRICECGLPAGLHEPKHRIWYCGSKECAQSRLWRLGLRGSSSSSSSSGSNGSNGSNAQADPWQAWMGS